MDLRGIQYDRYSRIEDHPLDRSVYPTESSPASIGCVDCLLPVQTDVADQQLANFAAQAVEEAFDVVDASDK